MNDYNQLLLKQREKFISDRSVQEQKFNSWLANARRWKPEVKAQLPFDLDTISIQQLMPTWYSEKPNKEQEAAELAKANELIETVNKIVDEYNMKAVGLIDEYQSLGG